MSVSALTTYSEDMSSSEPGADVEVRGATEADDQINDNTRTSKKVETNNVIGSEAETESAPGGSSSEPLASNQPDSEMHLAAALSDLTLHSPSTHIVGTPLPTDTSRFEYPFPEATSASDSPSPTSSMILTSTFPSLSTGSSFTSAGSQQSVISASPPTLPGFPTTFPPPSELHNYTPTHPKMKPGNPPVPPGLVKKRQRWSLGLLRRRSSSNGSQSSEASSPGAPGPGGLGSSNRVYNGSGLQSSSQTVPEGTIPPPPSD